MWVAWTSIFSKASTRPRMRTIVEAQNNTFCHRCGNLYLTWKSFSKHACAPTYRPLRTLPSEGLGIVVLFCFREVLKCSVAFSPPRLQLRSRYRSIVARAPKLQGRSSSLDGSHFKSLSYVVGWMQGLEPCITSTFRERCD